MEVDISKNVLYDIACTTLDRIEGLEVATAPIKVGEVLRGSGARTARRPKSLKVTREEGAVTFDVGVNVEYGRNLVNLSADVQRAITENVELMTGLKVRAVNVVVQGLTLPRGA
ncbi:Asp23/Gls24 family envelope stress response protein [Deinococcus pimensis]|uniref:Asp23/Gls24 family envelope stress response protein n=1 Tax=Deinococcus pimensis TaxID=309888 RepID=UPI000481DA3B|nr:Asp23/Gls24 family envelope stress response protein [Deinococcus pimensis]